MLDAHDPGSTRRITLGAAGLVGTDLVAKAKPDGYTLLMSTSSTFATNPALYKSLPFDVQADFAPITVTAFIPNLLVVNPSVPARNLAPAPRVARWPCRPPHPSPCLFSQPPAACLSPRRAPMARPG